MSRKVKRTFLTIALMVVVIIAAILWFMIDYRSVRGEMDDSHIGRNVSIGEVDVSGMTKEEAAGAVDSYIKSLGSKSITLTEKDNDNEVKVSAADLGLQAADKEKLVNKAFSYGRTGNIFERYKALKKLKKKGCSIALKLEVNRGDIKKVVENNTKKFEIPAKNATITRTSGGFEIKKEKVGIKVDIDKSVEAINRYMSGEWDKNSGEVALAVKKDVPDVTEGALKSIKDKLGTASTNYGGASGRNQNISSGVRHINGSVIMPGKTFSVNKTVSPFTAQNGYAMAGSYENGQVVESMGGGICQVSTTLYNAVLAAELEVVQRSPHSMIVTYVEPSKDAAIAGTYKDFKFKNNGDTPIYIEGSAGGGTITFSIYGKETRPANRRVEYVSELISTTQPKTKFVATGAPIGTKSRVSGGSHVGKKAKLWKVVYVDGKEESRTEVNSSNYQPDNRIVEVGTASDDERAVKEIRAAIASQNEARIDAAIAGAKQRAKEKEEEKKEEEEKKKAEEKKKEEDKKKAAENKTDKKDTKKSPKKSDSKKKPLGALLN